MFFLRWHRGRELREHSIRRDSNAHWGGWSLGCPLDLILSLWHRQFLKPFMASELKVTCRLHKITIAYVPHEDRVCFRGQSVAEKFIWLWITRGLLINLIPRLADCALALEASKSSDLYDAASLKPSVYAQSPDPVPDFARSRR